MYRLAAHGELYVGERDPAVDVRHVLVDVQGDVHHGSLACCDASAVALQEDGVGAVVVLLSRQQAVVAACGRGDEVLVVFSGDGGAFGQGEGELCGVDAVGAVLQFDGQGDVHAGYHSEVGDFHAVVVQLLRDDVVEFEVAEDDPARAAHLLDVADADVEGAIGDFEA